MNGELTMRSLEGSQIWSHQSSQPPVQSGEQSGGPGSSGSVDGEGPARENQNLTAKERGNSSKRKTWLVEAKQKKKEPLVSQTRLEKKKFRRAKEGN